MKSHVDNFDVPMGAYDSAQVADLKGIHISDMLGKIVNLEQVGLYRDYGIIFIPVSNGPMTSRMQKKIIRAFKVLGLRIEIASNQRIVNFLYVTLNLDNGTFKPFSLVSLFNSISTLLRLFNAKAILLEEQYYLTHSWEDKGVHTFPKGICPKVNVIARLENELAYYDSAVHRFSHYITPRGQPLKPFSKSNSTPTYINIDSNHPRPILKEIPNVVNLWIIRQSSCIKKLSRTKVYMIKPSKIADSKVDWNM